MSRYVLDRDTTVEMELNQPTSNLLFIGGLQLLLLKQLLLFFNILIMDQSAGYFIH